MAKVSKNKNVLSLIYFVGAGQTKSIQLSFFAIKSFIVFFLLLLVTASGLGFFAVKQFESIGLLKNQITFLKNGLFEFELISNDLLNKTYEPTEIASLPRLQENDQSPEEASATDQTTAEIESKSEPLEAVTTKKRPENPTPTTATETKQIKPVTAKKPSKPIPKTAPPRVTKTTLAAKTTIDDTRETNKMIVQNIRMPKSKNALSFNLVNNNVTDSRGNRIPYKGYLVVHARKIDDQSKTAGQTIFPERARVVDGNVTRYYRGYLFRIRTFKEFTIDLKQGDASIPYSEATFFVYSPSGTLIYKRTFNVGHQ